MTPTEQKVDAKLREYEQRTGRKLELTQFNGGLTLRGPDGETFATGMSIFEVNRFLDRLLHPNPAGQQPVAPAEQELRQRVDEFNSFTGKQLCIEPAEDTGRFHSLYDPAICQALTIGTYADLNIYMGGMLWAVLDIDPLKVEASADYQLGRKEERERVVGYLSDLAEKRCQGAAEICQAIAAGAHLLHKPAQEGGKDEK